MTTLSPSQLRAARALLNWSGAELAKRSGVSKPTIHRFENGAGDPENSTIQKIWNVLEASGIELIGSNGVALRNDNVMTLSGRDVFVRVLEDVVSILMGQKNSEALFACVCDHISPPIIVETYRKLRSSGIKMRSLVKEGDTYLLGELKEYRYLPGKYFHNNTTVIYGHKVATMILDPITGADVGAVIIQNPHVAASQRNLFNLIWSILPTPKKSTANTRYDGVA